MSTIVERIRKVIPEYGDYELPDVTNYTARLSRTHQSLHWRKQDVIYSLCRIEDTDEFYWMITDPKEDTVWQSLTKSAPYMWNDNYQGGIPWWMPRINRSD